MSYRVATIPMNFGLLPDYNWQVMSYVDKTALSKLPLADYQIDQYANILDWEVLSGKELAGWIFVKHKDKINWEKFITNGMPKEITYLIHVADKLSEYTYCFFSDAIKRQYYSTSHFISAFPHMIDFDWYVRHVKIPDDILLRYWNKMKAVDISKYQPISLHVMREKRHELIWRELCAKPMTEDMIEEFIDVIDWDIVCRWQKLSTKFLQKYKRDICQSEIAKNNVCQWQSLDGDFIQKNDRWVRWDIISRYQDLSIDFIQQHCRFLIFDELEKNINYNKANTIQIIRSRSQWFVIDAPIIDTQLNDLTNVQKENDRSDAYPIIGSSNIHFCSLYDTK